MLLFLLCVAKRSSSPKLWEADNSNRISKPGQANLTQTSGTLSGRSQTTVYLSFRLLDSATLPDYRAPRPNFVPRSRSVAQHKNKTYP